MKTIGLIGGMSWESSDIYYQLINRKIKQTLGGLHSCQCLMYSVDFAEIAHHQHAGNWDELAKMMVAAAQRLEKGGADFIVLCTNTMHKLANDIERNTELPFLHIADATANAIYAKKMKKVALLGTKFTMEQDFLKTRFTQNNIETLIPAATERDQIHQIIYEELVKGIVKDSSRQVYLEIINNLTQAGAEGIILGCTEIGMLITPEFTQVPLFDTTEIHAEAAVKMALA